MLNSVKVPKEYEAVFEKAQGYVSKYFSDRKDDPKSGTLEIFGERYILIRAASMSVDFFETIKNLYKNQGEEEAIYIARQLLFDIAYASGKQDAKNFHNKMNLKDPMEKLSVGPIHFSYSGWAFVDIFPESNPSPDENFFLVYDHPFSFESNAWQKSGKKSAFPVCLMSAGYSSGWCEESFGVSLVASEIMCKAKGDEACRFIMAHPDKIEDCIKKYLDKKPELAKKIISYEAPGYFKRKDIDRELKRVSDEWGKTFNAIGDLVFIQDKDFTITRANKAFADALKMKPEDIIGRKCYELLHHRDAPWPNCPFVKTKADQTFHIEEVDDPNIGVPLLVSTSPIFNEKGEIAGSVHIGKNISEQKRVQEELNKKIEFLEKFQKVTVDRELKMKELKSKVAELESKLQQK